MRIINNTLKLLLVIGLVAGLSGCDDPQVYGSIGISSGYSSYGHHRGYGSGMRTSISVGGRIY